MPRWRAQCDDVTPRLAPAIIPPYSPTPTSVHGGDVRLAAAPGTVEIPSPRPKFAATRATRGGTRVAQDLRPSDCSPDVFLPRLFVQFSDNMGPPVPTVSTNEVPIPAANYPRIPVVASRKPARIGGRGIIPAPRSLTRWPSAVAGVPPD